MPAHNHGMPRPYVSQMIQFFGKVFSFKCQEIEITNLVSEELDDGTTNVGQAS